MFVFPYFLGKEINVFSSGLLWDGNLEVGLPGWDFDAPIETFNLVLNRALITNDPLVQVLNPIANIYMKYAQVGFDTLSDIKPLDDRIKKANHFYPGNSKSYEGWNHYMDSDLVKDSLISIAQYPGMLGVISVEFIWRVFEYYLEEKNDPDKVLLNLNKRCSSLGSMDFLVFETILNRMQIFSKACYNNGEIKTPATNIKEIFDIISFGHDDTSEKEIPFDKKVDVLSFTIFDKILNPYLPNMNYKGSKAISEMFDKHNEELSLLKEKCKEESQRLLVDKPDENKFKFCFDQSLKSMKREVESLIKLDKNSLRNLYRTVTEDPAIWVLLSGLIGSISSGASPIITAGAGVTTLSKLGTSALKLNRKNKDTIENSDWSFIYHLSKKNV